MIAVTITLNVELFIFWLLVSFIIGFFIAFACAAWAVNKETTHDERSQDMTVGYKAESF